MDTHCLPISLIRCGTFAPVRSDSPCSFHIHAARAIWILNRSWTQQNRSTSKRTQQKLGFQPVPWCPLSWWFYSNCNEPWFTRQTMGIHGYPGICSINPVWKWLTIRKHAHIPAHPFGSLMKNLRSRSQRTHWSPAKRASAKYPAPTLPASVYLGIPSVPFIPGNLQRKVGNETGQDTSKLFVQPHMALWLTRVVWQLLCWSD